MATKKRSRYVRNADWDRYKHVVQKFLEDDSGRQTIGWCRHIDQMFLMGEEVYFGINRSSLLLQCFQKLAY